MLFDNTSTPIKQSGRGILKVLKYQKVNTKIVKF